MLHLYRLLKLTLMTNENIRLLLVDDNEINSLFAGIMFNKLNIPFDVACNKSQALGLIEKNTYSLVLLDIQMPIHDGYDIAKEIRSIDSKLPIIAFTSLPEEQVLPKAIDSGMNEYLLKPSAMQELRSILDRYKASA